jgi:hypothetical protein
MKIKGILFFYQEQGGGVGWAIQDERYIKPPTQDRSREEWSYEGLIYLQTGDCIRAFNKDGSVYWQGRIKLKQCKPVYSDSPWGPFKKPFMRRYLPSRQQWGEMFIGKLRGELTRN